jgi:hypothetical protein
MAKAQSNTALSYRESTIGSSDDQTGALVPALPIAQAKDIAARLAFIIEATSVQLGKKKYVQVEGWKSIAAEDGCCPAIESIEWVEAAGNRPSGVRAKAVLRRLSDGMVITSAFGFVGDDESTWKGRPQFAKEGMAQTRSLSRACKHRYDYVVVLMGTQYSTTPAEEMTGSEEGGDTKAGRQKEAAETQTITGVVSNTSTNQYKGKTYYFAEIDERKLMTAESDIGVDLVDAQGQEIAAVCVRRPGKGPNDFRVISFTYTESTADASQPEAGNDVSQGENPF